MVSQQPNPLLPDAPTVVVAGGGTGGHLYPAIAIAEALRKRLSDVRFVFFATRRAIDDRIVGQAGYEMIPQALPPLRAAPWHWPGILSGLHRSTRTCRSRLQSSRPLVVIGTGGWASVPAVCEARRAGVLTVLLNPDAIPGKANRLLANLADVVFVQWSETVERLPRKATVRASGCAIRPEFISADRGAGIERFGLDAHLKTLVITGASQGALTINQAVIDNLDYLRSLSEWQILHLTGEQHYDAVRGAYQDVPIRACVKPFTDHMADALGVADLVIARAGASTLAEITAVGRPSILMPYPYHKDMHQLANAKCLERASAARIVHDAADRTINGPALRKVLEELGPNGDRLTAMASAARRIGRLRAADEIADDILDLAAKRSVHSGCESVEALC